MTTFKDRIGIQICDICDICGKPPYTNNLAPLDKDKPAQLGNTSRASYPYTPIGDYTPALWQHRSAAQSPSPASSIASSIAEASPCSSPPQPVATSGFHQRECPPDIAFGQYDIAPSNPPLSRNQVFTFLKLLQIFN